MVLLLINSVQCLYSNIKPFFLFQQCLFFPSSVIHSIANLRKWILVFLLPSFLHQPKLDTKDHHPS